MWVQITPNARDSVGTTRLRDETGTLGQTVELSDNGKANVPKKVGEQMCEHYEHFERASSEEEEDDNE